MKHRRAYWTCQILGWGSYTLIGAATAAAQVGWTTEVTVGYGLYFLYSVGLTHLLRLMVHRRGWLEGARPAYIALFLAAWITGLIQGGLVVGISWLIRGSKSSFDHAIPASIFGISTITVGWMVLYLAVTSGRRARERQLALRDAELRALEAQVNPHFLFNCLNSIRGLVLENPPLAQDLITRLANILRYNLHRDAGHTVALDAELEVAADYLALESARFEDRLRIHYDVAPEVRRVPVPAMLLQTLVENAIKHGIAPRPDGGDLLIRAAAEDGAILLRVENPGELRASNGDRKQLGLRNIRERLRILYGANASLDLASRDGRVAASVRIPRTS